MSSARIQATNLTGSSATSRPEGGGWQWRGYDDWYPGNPKYRENTSERLLAGAAAHMARRRGREDQFAAILAELGVTDLADAPLAAIIEAGKRVGVGEKTAKSYRTALKRRQENPS
jgi:hypothetical protein